MFTLWVPYHRELATTMEGRKLRTERVCAIVIAVFAASITEVDNIRYSRVNMMARVLEFVGRNWDHTGKAAGKLCELWKQGSARSPK